MQRNGTDIFGENATIPSNVDLVALGRCERRGIRRLPLDEFTQLLSEYRAIAFERAVVVVGFNDHPANPGGGWLHRFQRVFQKGLQAGVMLRVYVAEFYISRRFSSERDIVTSSANSRSLPTGMPIAIRVTRGPSGFKRRAK